MDTTNNNNDLKIIRAPSLKRGKNDGGLAERIKLKRVLGLTVCSNAALDVSPTNGVLAYPAGCTVVLFNSKKLSQSYLLNTSRKAITAIAYSRCGRYLATGECGQNPAIKVWELDSPNGLYENSSNANNLINNNSNSHSNNNNGTHNSNSNNNGNNAGTVIGEFLGHKYAISCIAFSPTGKYLVSVGSQHDMIVNVFDWKMNLKIASNKVSAKVVAVCFSEDGNYFVTVGNRHVKYWYLEGSRKYKEPIPLMGRSAILGELRNNDFCAVACGKGDMIDSTYAITRNGHLVEFNSRRLLDKWVACRTASANCLCTSTNYILVGCAESIIRVFDARTLEYMTTLPRTHYLGVDVGQGIHINHITAAPTNAKYPDTIAMVFDEQRGKVSCVYNDHSLYIWDLRDIRRIGKSHSFLYHSACIWGVETVPFNMNALKKANGGGGGGGTDGNSLPLDCFLTCSSDDTIRVWGLDGECDNNDVYRKNIYSKELLKVLYIDDELNFIKDTDNPILNMEKSSSYDGRNGVRCIKINTDCNHLATGDRNGNIRIYNLKNLMLITTIEAHDSEVLCLEYTSERIDRKMLASASRDRLIHIFDVENGYQILQTLDDHSSSITSVKFIGSNSNFQMVSCGADKSIIFRTFQNNQFLRGNNCSGKNTLYDMEIDSNSKHILTACQDRNIRIYGTQNAKHTKTFKGSHSDEGSLIKLSLDLSGIYIATSCTDKTLSVYDYYSTECMARMYGHSELVTGLKFTNDCKYLISASGDGCIFIWQVPHDMIVTMQARLSQQALRSGHHINYAQHLQQQQQQQQQFNRPVSLPTSIINNNNDTQFNRRSADHHQPYQHHQQYGGGGGGIGSPTTPIIPSTPNYLTEDIPLSPGYKFSDVGQLPQWAKKKDDQTPQQQQPTQYQPQPPPPQSSTSSSTTTTTNILSSSPSQSQIFGNNTKPRGRWGQKGPFEPSSDVLDLRNLVESPNSSYSMTTSATIQSQSNSSNQTSDYNSSSSKDVYNNNVTNNNNNSNNNNNNNNNNNMYLSEDSSIDSGVENHRRDQMFLSKQNTQKSNQINFESNTEHDGDIEDISDGERTSSDHGLMFYPSTTPGTPTDFKVNAMNEEELRKSVRRQKFERQGLQLVNTTISLSQSGPSTGTGTGTSDDEDDGSTPSGDNAERSLASTLGGSSESIPQQMSSSSFLQAALDGPGSLSDRSDRKRRSISAKHNTDNKVNGSFTKSFTNTKKEELMKVINEAKQKLENVGYRSNLRASQSISDLSHSAAMERNKLQRSGGNQKSLQSVQNADSSIRRACSLSDLSMGKGGIKTSNSMTFKSSTSNVSVLTGNRNSISSSNRLTASKRNTISMNKSATLSTSSPMTAMVTGNNNSGMGTRSVSVGTLNQASDSDAEANGNSRGGVLRPTISSQNKINNGQSSSASLQVPMVMVPPPRQYATSKNAAGIINRRRGLTNAYSSVNISTVGQDDSSSEEAQSIPMNNGKPIVPPRPRSISVEHKRNQMGNVIANTGGGGGGGVSGSMNKGSNHFDEFPSKDTDIINTDSSIQLCSHLITQLMATTKSVMQLHQNLKHSDDTQSSSSFNSSTQTTTTTIGNSGQKNKQLMLKELENAAIMTQNMLTKITNNRLINDSTENSTNNNNNNNNSSHHQVSFQNNINNNNNIPMNNSSIIQQNGEYIQMMDKCSDILNTVQKQVKNT